MFCNMVFIALICIEKAKRWTTTNSLRRLLSLPTYSSASIMFAVCSSKHPFIWRIVEKVCFQFDDKNSFINECIYGKYFLAVLCPCFLKYGVCGTAFRQFSYFCLH